MSTPFFPQSALSRRASGLGIALVFAIFNSACGDGNGDDGGPQMNNSQPGNTGDTMAPNQPSPKHEALGPGSNTAPREGEMTVTVPFSAQVGGEAVRCGVRYPGVGLGRSEIEFEELAFYIHNVAFKNSQGVWTPLRLQDDGRFQSQDVALVDFLDDSSPACAAQGTPDTHTYISGYLPEGQYSAIRYTLGIPKKLNHIDASYSVSPFNRPRMWWTWLRGYRYLKADIKTWTQGEDGTMVEKPRYFSHSGANKCAIDPVTKAYDCKDPRLVDIELAYDLNTQGIIVDLAKYYSRDDLSKGRGCMGASSVKDKQDPEGTVSDSCLAHYLSMGLDTSGELAMPTGAQDLFAAVPWNGQKPAAPNHVPLAQADTKEGRRNIHLWPRMDYVRPAKLDEKPSTSEPLKTDSHPFDDPRAFESCSNCHQQYGPGDSIYSFAGTIFREDGLPYTEGFIEIVSSEGKANRREPDPAKKLTNPVVHMRVPIDGHGQFYVTQDLATAYATQNNVPALNFRNTNYQAYVVNRDGHRVQAMAVNATGSCNHCHTGGFKLEIPNRLLSGPWTPKMPH